MTDPAALTAAAAAARLRDGTLTVVALAQACLDRIAAREPRVRAWSHVDPELVLAEARRLDAAAVRGPLHGLPVGVKDVILTRDMPTQYNSEIYRGFHPRMDAACVSILRSAGALILGKTETVEFAATGRSAATANPHDLARTPGGSSSGSAAAVADGHTPLALGTQTGGSMIRPASFCGIYAIKPTWGLINRDGARPFAPTLDTIGWFARSAEDLALVYDVFDPRPGATAPAPVAGARIALCRTPMWPQAEPATRAAMQAAEAALRAAGAEVVELALPPQFDDLHRLQPLIMRAEGGVVFLPEYRACYDQLGQTFRDQVENADGFSRAALCAAYDHAADCRRAFDEIAASYDAVLTPSSTGAAPLGLAATGAMTFNGMWTLLHAPCIGVPGFVTADGLPVGLTLTGPRFADRRLLGVAATVGPLLSGLR